MLHLVYLIIAYKNADQVLRLVRRLNAPTARFLIHIDKKADDAFFDSLRRSLGDYSNCAFIKRESVYWGAWGLVQAQLNAIRYIQDNELPCDFLIHMSGQDYPLHSNERIQKFLAENKGKQFIDCFPMPAYGWEKGGLTRYELYHFCWRGRRFVYPPDPDRGRLVRALLPFLPFKTRRIPGAYYPHGGMAAVTLAQSGVAYLNEFIRSRLGRKMIRYFRKTMCPDELFFQTVLANSPLRGTIVGDDLRYMDWSGGGAHPKVLTSDDFQMLKASGRMFARKFDTGVDAEILNMLDAAADVGTGIRIRLRDDWIPDDPPCRAVAGH